MLDGRSYDDNQRIYVQLLMQHLSLSAGTVNHQGGGLTTQRAI